jgi:hypothetical protein
MSRFAILSSEFLTKSGIIFAVTAAAFIVFPFLLFLAYDRKVARQKQLIMTNAKRSNAIVSALFPSNVRDKLYPQGQDDPESRDVRSEGIKSFSSAPIAELYPETTVLFAGTY